MCFRVTANPENIEDKDGVSNPFKLRWLAERGTAASIVFVCRSLHVGQRGTKALEQSRLGKTKNGVMRW